MLVNEIYSSWQGSGYLAGVFQTFVRVAGCRVPCPIRKVCDQQDALHEENGVEHTPWFLLRHVIADWLHLTGGEPVSDPDFERVCSEAAVHGKKVHVQTSGLVPTRHRPTWLTVSPKSLDLKVTRGDEMIVVAGEWVTSKVLATLRKETEFTHYFLQPLEIEGQFDPRWRELINDDWRLTGQLHKQLGLR